MAVAAISTFGVGTAAVSRRAAGLSRLPARWRTPRVNAGARVANHGVTAGGLPGLGIGGLPGLGTGGLPGLGSGSGGAAVPGLSLLPGELAGLGTGLASCVVGAAQSGVTDPGQVISGVTAALRPQRLPFVDPQHRELHPVG